MTAQPAIGFIGLGLMGQGFTKRLAESGFKVTGYDLVPGKVKTAAAHGVIGAESPAAVAAASDIVLVCVTSTDAVQEAVFGDGGVAEAPGRGKVLVDHSTTEIEATKQFAADLEKSRKLIEDASGAAVSGYRAPSFSIDARTLWAHPILAEQGYAYSSSVAPVKHDHYGWPESPRFAWKPVAGSDLVELPVTTAKFRGRTLAAGGGGFFRLLPYGFSRWAIRQVNGEAHQPAIIYFHPWEIDPGQPRVRQAPVKSKLRHYTNLAAMAPKLKRLARDFQWGTVRSLLD